MSKPYDQHEKIWLFDGASSDPSIKPPKMITEIIDEPEDEMFTPVIVEVDESVSELADIDSGNDEITSEKELELDIVDNQQLQKESKKFSDQIINTYYRLRFDISASKKTKKFYDITEKIGERKSGIAVLTGLLLVSSLLVGSNEYASGSDTDDLDASTHQEKFEAIDEFSLEPVEVTGLQESLLNIPADIPTTTTTTTTTSTSTTTTVSPTTVTAQTEEPQVVIESPQEVPPVTTVNIEPVDIYASLNCSNGEAAIEKGWTFSELAEKCGLKPSTLQSFNPQISDYNSIVIGTKINLNKPLSSNSSSNNASTESSPNVECVAIGGTIKPLQEGFTIEGYLKNLGYTNNQALFLAYSTSLASDYGLDGSLIAGNNYCLPTVEAVLIRYGV